MAEQTGRVGVFIDGTHGIYFKNGTVIRAGLITGKKLYGPYYEAEINELAIGIFEPHLDGKWYKYTNEFGEQCQKLAVRCSDSQIIGYKIDFCTADE